MRNNQREFSSEIPSEWMSILYKQVLSIAHNKVDPLTFLNNSTHVKETLAFLNSAQNKITYAVLDLNSFYFVTGCLEKVYCEWHQKLLNKVRVSGKVDTTINYLSTQVPGDVLLNKISYNFFNSFHSFFDTYAHFLHKSLFPDVEISQRLSFFQIRNQIKNDSSLNEISEIIEGYASTTAFKYLNAVDNTNKHRKLVLPEITISLNDGTLEMLIPQFNKGEKYKEKEIEGIIEDCYELCVNFYNKVTEKVFEVISLKISNV